MQGPTKGTPSISKETVYFSFDQRGRSRYDVISGFSWVKSSSHGAGAGEGYSLPTTCPQRDLAAGKWRLLLNVGKFFSVKETGGRGEVSADMRVLTFL